MMEQCLHSLSLANLYRAIAEPGNSFDAVQTLTSHLSVCRSCAATECPGIASFLFAEILTSGQENDSSTLPSEIPPRKVPGGAVLVPIEPMKRCA